MNVSDEEIRVPFRRWVAVPKESTKTSLDNGAAISKLPNNVSSSPTRSLRSQNVRNDTMVTKASSKVYDHCSYSDGHSINNDHPRTDSSHRQECKFPHSSDANGKHHYGPTMSQDQMSTDKQSGDPGVQFKCPSLTGPSRNCVFPTRSDSKSSLRKAIKSQIVNKRDSTFTDHVRFVQSNTLTGTKVATSKCKSGKKLPCDGKITRHSTDENYELLAILCVQEHNLPDSI